MEIGNYYLGQSESTKPVMCEECSKQIIYKDFRLKIIRPSNYGWDRNIFFCDKCMEKSLKEEIKQLEKCLLHLKDMFEIIENERH